MTRSRDLIVQEIAHEESRVAELARALDEMRAQPRRPWVGLQLAYSVFYARETGRPSSEALLPNWPKASVSPILSFGHVPAPLFLHDVLAPANAPRWLGLVP